MRFVYQNADLEREVADVRSADQLDAVAKQIADLVPSFFQPEIYGRQLFWPQMDALVPALAAKLQLADVAGERSNEQVCILATRFYPTGGHSKVAADIARQLGAERTTVVFTDLYRQLRYRQFLGGDPTGTPVERRSLVLLSAAGFTDKILELYEWLKAIRPTRIILMCNHMDLVAVTAAWPFRSVVEFIHHADHLPALGATLPFSAHVDLNYPVHLACHEAGLSPVFASLSAPRLQAFEGATEGLRIATCGGLMKYRHGGRYRWVDYACAALAQPDAQLVHIGPVDDAFRSEVDQALLAAQIDPARYEFAGVVPDLQAELAARGANLFLASYPTSGGRANLEAMACGIPVISPTDADAPPLIPDRWPVPQFTTVATPDALTAKLADAAMLMAAARDPANLAQLGLHLRRFERYVAGEPLEPFAISETLPE